MGFQEEDGIPGKTWFTNKKMEYQQNMCKMINESPTEQ
jgi:hypothetical protein